MTLVPPPGTKRTGATQNRGGSTQIVCTPRDFISACETRFGRITFDLAAERENSVAHGNFFSKEQNALVQDWSRIEGNAFVNPPFARLGEFAAKCAEETAKRPRRWRRILFLGIASVSSNWWADCVHEKAKVLFLNGRIRFVGHDADFPQSVSLNVYGELPGYQIWPWHGRTKRSLSI